MESRIICTEIWRNSDFRKLDHQSRTIVLFLLSNDRIPVLPIYQIPLDEICFFCNVSEKKFYELLPNLQKFGIYFIDDYFLIDNKFTRAKYTGGKTEEKRNRLHQSLPDALRDLIDTDGVIGQSLTNVLGNHSSNQQSINHKPETINHKSKTEFSKFEDLTNDVCLEIAEKYSASLQDVLDTKLEMEVWLGKSSKNKYSNYKLALMTWVKKNSNNFKRRSGYVEIIEE